MKTIKKSDFRKYSLTTKNPRTKFVIGFTNVYFTAWEITTYEVDKRLSDGFVYTCGNAYDFKYIQNLSMDKATAVAKFRKMFPNAEIEISESVKGKTRSFSTSNYDAEKLPSNYIKGGKYDGKNMENIEDLPYLCWYVNSEYMDCEERKAVLIAFLIDKGCYLHEGKMYDAVAYAKLQEKLNAKALHNSYTNGHLFGDEGSKVELVGKVLNTFENMTMYGCIYKVELLTENNELFYLEGSTDYVEKYHITKGDVIRVKGTTKFQSYRSRIGNRLVQYTKLLRAKVIS